MANEIQIDYPSGDTLYAVRFNPSGQVALSDGSAFENWGTGERDADDYDVALSEVGSGGSHYVGDFDSLSNISLGRYSVVVFKRAGASPSDGDPVIGSGKIIWTGTGELTADKVLANKAIQNKSTGAVAHYDDDGSTVLITLTPTDGASDITRTPS